MAIHFLATNTHRKRADHHGVPAGHTSSLDLQIWERNEDNKHISQQQSDAHIVNDPLDITAGHIGIAPIFVGAVQSTGEHPAVGSDACDVGACIPGVGLDPVAMYQDITLGFRVGGRSLFEGVTRLKAGYAIRADQTGRLVEAESALTECKEMDPDGAIHALATQTAELASRGAMIELSGGIDSRLVLALALSGGCVPVRAMTLGEPNSPDVIVARLIAKKFGIDHVVIDADPTPETLLEDADAFAKASGYVGSLASYAWLPGIFRRLTHLRDQQLSGMGGERHGGFYYTPLDCFSSLPLFEQAWASYRLRIPGINPTRVFRKDIAGLLDSETFQDVRLALGRGDRTWRERLDAFYEQQRLRHWASSVFRASSHWYDVQAPLLWPEFTSWISAVPHRTAQPRDALVDLIGRLNPELASFPYASDIKGVDITQKPQPKPVRLARKITSRVFRKRKTPDLGAGHTAAALAANDEMILLVENLLEAQCDCLNAPSIRSMLSSASSHAHELGFLFTWSLAHRDLEQARAAVAKKGPGALVNPLGCSVEATPPHRRNIPDAP